jgi:hypothetical protein
MLDSKGFEGLDEEASVEISINALPFSSSILAETETRRRLRARVAEKNVDAPIAFAVLVARGGIFLLFIFPGEVTSVTWRRRRADRKTCKTAPLPVGSTVLVVEYCCTQSLL